MRPDRRTVLLGLFGAIASPAFAKPGLDIAHGHAFGSGWRIVTDTAVPMSLIRSRIDATIAQVDSQMSPYLQSSDLSRFNRTTSQDWQAMPKPLCHVAAQALRVAALTDGAFDPTVGPIVSSLGFGPIEGAAEHYSGLDVAATAMRKAKPGLTLDLCGIAKGYALDRIIGALRRAGVSDALVELGGEVRALGHHPDGREWTVAIAEPHPQRFSAYRIVAPGRLAIATSGHAFNGVTGPISTSHIIDTARGQSARPDLRSVSVLAPTAIEADALATALCARGADAGITLARRLGISALFLRDPEAGASEVMTGRFSDHVLI